MKRLSGLPLEPSYHKGTDDIANAFYLPCMKRAVQYDRAVGFFKSSIYMIAWGSLREFVNNGGNMRIICSPVLASEDRNAIEKGYEARSDEKIASKLQTTIQTMLETPTLEKPTKVLASLVAEEVIEFKIATIGEDPTPRHKRLFHDKLGIFQDEMGESNKQNAVVFKGSMNETWAGLAMDGNLESVDVYVSWGDERERERVQSEQDYFNSLWLNEYDTVTVSDFPDVAEQELISAADEEKWTSLVDDIVDDIKHSQVESPDSGPDQRVPLPHQREALEEWRNKGRRGILEHATGSGKTFTALCAIRDALKRDEIPVVFVPNTDLLTQWNEELETTNRDLDPDILICGDGRTKWREDGLLRSWTRPSDGFRIVLTTMQTGITDDFQALFADGDHIFLIADEVHRVGSTEHSRILDFESKSRLGLSATPRRAGDPEGTEAIMNYFEGIVQPPFTLSNAIEAGRLTPYFYYVHPVSLTPDEQEDWEQETKKIAKRYAQAQSGDETNHALLDLIKRLQIKRARIIKKARNKVNIAKLVLDQYYSSGDRWLVYCSGMEQLSTVAERLREDEFRVFEYHNKMSGDREQTLKYFENNGGIILSIKCLDEGVDIPNATHALILASSKNPREFIQRRGRVLRKAPNKYHAHVHDTVVMPYATDVDASVASILEGELARAIKFGEDAENPKAVADLQEIALEAGIDYKEVAETGVEDD